MQHLKEPIADLVDNILVAIMRHSIHQDTPACRVKHKRPISAIFLVGQAVCLYGCPGIPIEILWLMRHHDLIQSVEIPDAANADKLSLVSVDCWKNQHHHLSTRIVTKVQYDSDLSGPTDTIPDPPRGNACNCQQRGISRSHTGDSDGDSWLLDGNGKLIIVGIGIITRPHVMKSKQKRLCISKFSSCSNRI